MKFLIFLNTSEYENFFFNFVAFGPAHILEFMQASFPIYNESSVLYRELSKSGQLREGSKEGRFHPDASTAPRHLSEN